VCLGSALQWWRRLEGVFPVSDFELGSVFGLITGDPDPVTSSRERVVPACNRDLFPADSPAHGLVACPSTGRCPRLPATAGRQQHGQLPRFAVWRGRQCAPRSMREKAHLEGSISPFNLPRILREILGFGPQNQPEPVRECKREVSCNRSTQHAAFRRPNGPQRPGKTKDLQPAAGILFTYLSGSSESGAFPGLTSTDIQVPQAAHNGLR
jgi:hypothetical protein